MSLAALGIAIKGVFDINDARRTGRLEDCYLLRGLVANATPPGQQAAAAAFLARTPLRDCQEYADHPNAKVSFHVYKQH